MSRAESNAVKRFAYEDGLSVNKWLQAIIRQALAQRLEQDTEAVAVSRRSPAPAAPRRDPLSRHLVETREAEQTALPVGRPAREANDDARPAFFQARK